eukprot:5461123-Amphidinium_carterae.1
MATQRQSPLGHISCNASSLSSTDDVHGFFGGFHKHLHSSSTVSGTLNTPMVISVPPQKCAQGHQAA